MEMMGGDGSPYRKWNYYNFKTGKDEEVEAIPWSWKNLYEKKGVEMGFRVFPSFLGMEQPLYILATWAEDPLDYHTNLQKTSGLLGEEGAALWSKMMEYAEEVKVVEGWYLPQYSFAPDMELTK